MRFAAGVVGLLEQRGAFRRVHASGTPLRLASLSLAGSSRRAAWEGGDDLARLGQMLLEGRRRLLREALDIFVVRLLPRLLKQLKRLLVGLRLDLHTLAIELWPGQLLQPIE